MAGEVRAALISLEYAPKTHSGLDSLIHNILVKDRDLLTMDQTQTFSKLKTRREQTDYETGFYGMKEEFDELRPQVEQLVTYLTQVAIQYTAK